MILYLTPNPNASVYGLNTVLAWDALWRAQAGIALALGGPVKNQWAQSLIKILPNKEDVFWAGLLLLSVVLGAIQM